MAWDLVRRVPVKGDRREHFEAETEVWEIAMRIAAVRKEREIDPAVDALKACVADADRDPKLHPVAARRLKDMLGFVETMDRWYAQMLTVPKPKLAALMRLGARVISLLPLGKPK
jgi:DNA-binding transcriptional regulator GbsR (MarR family)